MIDIADSMRVSLENNYEEVSVGLKNTPDFRNLGFTYFGMGGENALCDFGGVPFLLDPKWQDVYFDLKKVRRLLNMPKKLVLGAAAAWNEKIGVNGELMPFISIENRQNFSYFSIINKKGICYCGKYPHMNYGSLSNIFISEGNRDYVLHFQVEARKGEKDLINCIRGGLINHFACNKGKQIALGGSFFVKEGKVKMHVMPDFRSCCMFDGTKEVVDDWLNYFEVGPNLICLTTVLTGDPCKENLSLRFEHTHFFSVKDERLGGHYHNDTTPSKVKYSGYFYPVQKLFRIRNAWNEVILPKI